MRAHASGIKRRLARSLALALALGMLSAAIYALVVAPQAQVARAANPSVSIVSPTSASGPVQTGIRVVGNGWNGGASIQIFYNPPANNQPCGDPNNSQALAQSNPLPGVPMQTARPDGTWTIDFQWPSNTGAGQFYICAFDTTTPTQVTPSDKAFQVLSTSLPAITVDKQFPNVGDQITINGTGFLPGNQPIDLFISAPNQSPGVKLTTATADNGGNFSVKATLPTSPTGQVNIVALSRTPVSGALPPLSASQEITVGATPSTPTPGPTDTTTPEPTETTTPTANNTGTNQTASTKPDLLLVTLIVLLILVILAIFGVMIWYVLGTRPPAGVGAPGAPAPPAGVRAPAASRRSQDSWQSLPEAPRRSQDSWQSLPDWQTEDEWEGQQGPWEEDPQGGWNELPTQWSDEANPWPSPQSGPAGPSAPPTWSGPAGRGNAGAQRPAPPRGPYRNDRQGRARSGQEDW